MSDAARRSDRRTQAVYYRDRNGVQPVDAFIDGLAPKRAGRLDTAIAEHLSGRPSHAPPPAFPASSQVAGELRELRVRVANTRYRVLYQRSDNLVVLLHAFEKNRGTLARSDVAVARRRMVDFQQRMNASPRISPRAVGRDAGVGTRIDRGPSASR